MAISRSPTTLSITMPPTINLSASLDHCWLGDQLSTPIELNIQVVGSTVTFSGMVPWQVAPISLSSAGFIENLWKRDVVEFFIAKKNSPAYIEFNLAPSSAWWCTEYRSYRHLVSTVQQSPPAKVITSCSVTPAAWNFYAKMSLQELFGEHTCSSATEIESINLACIQGVASSAGSAQRFFATNATPNRPPQPDFHHRHTFLLVQP